MAKAPKIKPRAELMADKRAKRITVVTKTKTKTTKSGTKKTVKTKTVTKTASKK